VNNNNYHLTLTIKNSKVLLHNNTFKERSVAATEVKKQWLSMVFCFVLGWFIAPSASAIPDINNMPLSEAVKKITLELGVQLEGANYLSKKKVMLGSEDMLSQLESWLNNEPISWQLNEQLLKISPKIAKENLNKKTQDLPQMLVLAELEPTGLMVFDRSQLNQQPSGNGDLTSVLKTHPNVQFDNNQLSSKTPGEIAPANISINGAHFYQNAFVVDGVGFNNDIDSAQDNPALLDSAPGRSQGLALDLDLLDSIQVYDSNIPASYGGFTGGVVEANTRSPSKEFSGKVSLQTSRSSWTNYHIDKRESKRFEQSGNAEMQPKFTKWTRRTHLEGHLTENLGLIASVNQKRSTIPLSFYSANNTEEMGYKETKQKRAIDNYFLKSVWSINDQLSLDSSVTYAPETNHYFASNIMNSGVDLKSGGQQYAIKLKWDADLAHIEQSLAYSVLEQSRDSDSNDYYVWRKSAAKDWGIGSKPTTNSLEGGFGDIEQQQQKVNYKLDVKFEPWVTSAVTQHWNIGLEASWGKVDYERLIQGNVYVIPIATNSCARTDGSTADACSMSPTINGWDGQYMTMRTRYNQGRFSFTTHELAAYMQNDLHLDRLKLRPGVRVDSDNYMDKTTVAPRLAAEFDVNGDRKTLINAGANRYYGRSIKAWRLQDGRNRLRFTDRRTGGADADWKQIAHALNTSTFSKLDVPYDDELVLGIKQKIAGLQLEFKYVNRAGKDQVIKVRGTKLEQPSTDPTLSKNYTTYTNDGHSHNDIYTLTMQPIQPIIFVGTETKALLALDWSKSKASSPSYEVEGDTYFDNDYIRYKGDFIRYSDRPSDNYNRPWTVRLNTTTEIEKLNINISNLLRYRAAYSKVGNTGKKIEYNNNLINVWDDLKYKPTLTWDMRVGWKLFIAKNQNVFVNLDVFNVLDKQVVSAASTTNEETAIPTYEVGRQFWLEAGYQF